MSDNEAILAGARPGDRRFRMGSWASQKQKENREWENGTRTFRPDDADNTDEKQQLSDSEDEDNTTETQQPV